MNETRGKIAPYQYKDYIFGLIFYKFLSGKAQNWLIGQLRGETWANIWKQNPEKAAAFMQSKLDYVIQPGELFSDWQKSINTDQFNVSNVADALVHFN